MENKKREVRQAKRWFSKVILGTISAALLVIVLIQAALWGAVVWLNTQNGQDWVNAQVKTALEGSGYSVEVTGLSYRPFTTLVIRDLKIRKNDALFVEGRNIYLHAELMPMIAKELMVSAIADQIIIHEIVKPNPEEKRSLQLPSFAELALPDLYFTQISLHKISVKDLQLSESLSLSPSMSAKINFKKDRAKASVQIKEDSGFVVKKLSLDAVVDGAGSLVSLNKIDVTGHDFIMSSKGQYNLKTPKLDLDAVIKLLNGKKGEDIFAKITAENRDQKIGGDIHIESNIGKNSIVFKSAYVSGGKSFDLSSIDLKGFGASVLGQASLDQQAISASGSASMADTAIEQFELDISHAQTPYKVSFSATGTREGHLIATGLSFDADPVNTVIDKLSGHIKLKESAVGLSGFAGMEKLDLKLDFKNFSLLDLPSNMGTVSRNLFLNGKLSVLGSPDVPVLNSDFSIRPADGNPNVTIKAKGGYKDKALSYDFGASGQGIKALTGNISMPAHLSLKPFVFDLKSDTAIGGNIEANLDVMSLAALVLPPDQEVSGTLHASGQIKGVLEKPDIVLDVMMNKGTYHHKGLGFQLKDIDLKAGISDGRATLTSLSATDGEDGSLKASGFYDLAKNSFDIDVSSRNLHALQDKMIDGSVDLDVDWQGDFKNSLVKGEITTQKITVTIPHRFSQTIPSLNIVKSSDKKKKIEPFGENIALDISVKAPQQIFVSGWGLDAEFGGALDIGGTVYKPVIEGEFESLRGKYKEFGRRFEIEHAKIFFKGESPPSPQIDVLSATEAEDITAKIGIKGYIQKPSISFSSVPDLSEDEIISRILFGKSMEKITPFQAVELAQTLQRFSGSGGGASGLNPMGLVKGLTGLDDVRVDTDEEGETTVGAGKYLTDKVYLEFETGTGENAGGANLEVELTPHISIESEIGQDAQGGAGVFWNWDY
ncbi:MAG: translocation/assembly module TamB domain-containing protein [Alphaproteobacteria bacterium]|nr:translocation/assembly module TamB domain-containing protein [Alphaproteobacteria bacterium]